MLILSAPNAPLVPDLALTSGNTQNSSTMKNIDVWCVYLFLGCMQEFRSFPNPPFSQPRNFRTTNSQSRETASVDTVEVHTENLLSESCECDAGTVMLARSLTMAEEVEKNKASKAMGSFYTLENPPESELTDHQSAWEMEETKAFIDRWHPLQVKFNTCVYEKEKELGQRHFKPQKFVGSRSLQGLRELEGECKCGRAGHDPVVGPAKSKASAEYPKRSCVPNMQIWPWSISRRCCRWSTCSLRWDSWRSTWRRWREKHKYWEQNQLRAGARGVLRRGLGQTRSPPLLQLRNGVDITKYTIGEEAMGSMRLLDRPRQKHETPSNKDTQKNLNTYCREIHRCLWQGRDRRRNGAYLMQWSSTVCRKTSGTLVRHEVSNLLNLPEITCSNLTTTQNDGFTIVVIDCWIFSNVTATTFDMLKDLYIT